MKLVSKTGLLAGCLLLAHCQGDSDEQLLSLSGNTMGTSYTLSLVAKQSPPPLEITELLEQIDSTMSTYRDDSELMQLNHAPLNTWIEVSPPLFEMLKLSEEISRLTDGAFDITVGSLVNLWGFGPQISRLEQIPAADEITSQLMNIGYEYLQLNPQRQAVMKTRDLTLDLSAIAKGYGVDRIAGLLEALGITNYLVEIGGEIRSRGRNSQGQPWRIAIETPEAGQSERNAQRIIQVDAASIATSGNYRNFFTVAGTRYSHTIDPRSGRPVTHALSSVTVIAKDAATADALATAFSVLGEASAQALAEEHSIAAYFLIENAGGFRESYSPAFAKYLVRDDKP